MAASVECQRERGLPKPPRSSQKDRRTLDLDGRRVKNEVATILHTQRSRDAPQSLLPADFILVWRHFDPVCRRIDSVPACIVCPEVKDVTCSIELRRDFGAPIANRPLKEESPDGRRD